MQKLSDCLPSRQPDGWQMNSSTTGQSAPASLEFQRARRVAGKLLREFAPVIASVRAATNNPVAADVWLDSWARRIINARLAEEEIKTGLVRLDDAPDDRPFDWIVFLRLCRPKKDLVPLAHRRLALPEPVDMERGRRELAKIREKFGWH